MSNDLVQQQQPMAISLGDQMNYAKAVSQAGILPQAYRGKPADVLVAIGLGQSMGLTPMESLYRINVIQGKPTASAELIAAQVRRAGHRLRITKDEQHVSVTATIIRADDPEAPFSVTRDQQWAQQMGLAGKDNYKKQPLTMLTWRAITAVAREACPESLYGIAYTPDEMHDLDRIPAPSVDTGVHVTVEDDSPADPPVAQQNEVMASTEQAQRINNLLRQGGVTNTNQAHAAFRALCGQDIGSAAQLSQIDAENLLSAPELVISRVKDAIKPHEEEQQ
ncbi:hypothetical protein CSQ85_00330 [Bifidobacterium rousetti]|uniref:recombinase RecT n=1 Tax=Bifidobacterium rousetti TaxID=2045439 RepID=UPI00123B0CBF|nr:recombinase RecT [Bifidobacterium rousetti]KAA8820297.1 hypothetical protein CSQ85_00330 [Bifidobacterium rousetti]